MVDKKKQIVQCTT